MNIYGVSRASPELQTKEIVQATFQDLQVRGKCVVHTYGNDTLSYNFIATDGVAWMDANRTVKGNSLKGIETSISAEGVIASVAINVNTRKTPKAFGIKLPSFE
jgi:hypothetical protein